MKALAGVKPPSEGTITVNGEPLESRLTDIGYLPQDEIVHGRLTVYEALDYAARLRLPSDTSAQEIEDTVDRVIDELELEAHGNTRIELLSGGQRKRVGLAAELLSRPSLLFLDEPTTGLDPGLEARMMLLLRDLADRDRAVMVVTHATKSLDTCAKIVVMGRGGRLCFHGPPEEALTFFGAETFDDIYAAARPSAGRGVAAQARAGAAGRGGPPRGRSGHGAGPDRGPPGRPRLVPGSGADPSLRAALRPRPAQPAHPAAAGPAPGAGDRRAVQAAGVQGRDRCGRGGQAALPRRDDGHLARVDRRRARDHQGEVGLRARGRGRRQHGRVPDLEGGACSSRSRRCRRSC